MARDRRPQRILVISQVYVPDPASVGQHMADAAESLAARDYDVRVLASARGYDDPSQRYPLREYRGGVEVIRLPWSSFGKRTILLRLLGQSIFLIQAILRGVFTPRLAGVFVSTSPPLCSVAALIVHWIRRVPMSFWWMDINPDQMIAFEKIKSGGVVARVFDWLNRRILKNAAAIVALDRFMADRLVQKFDVRERITVLPPWPHVEAGDSIAKSENPFVAEHGLADKFVVMYSGNHGLALPLETLIQAALRLRDHPRLHFMFIGGGHRKKEVEEAIAQHRPPNMVSLPYQPLERLQFSLSAADMHVVTMADNMVGIIHPCKIYGAMAVGRPILYVGPRPSHVSDLIDEYQIGWQIGHGDVDEVVRVLTHSAETSQSELEEMGRRAQRAVRDKLSKQILSKQFADAIERGLAAPRLASRDCPATADAAVAE